MIFLDDNDNKQQRKIIVENVVVGETIRQASCTTELLYNSMVRCISPRPFQLARRDHTAAAAAAAAALIR